MQVHASRFSHSAPGPDSGRYIYLACPWTPVGGGMFKVADYLIQSQSGVAQAGRAQLRPLDTRGASSALFSLLVLTTALFKVLRGRLSGRLVGIHVNMGQGLSLVRKGLVVMTGRALGVPVVLHLHAVELYDFYRRLPRPPQALIRWIFSLPSLCIVLGPAAKRFVTEELCVPPEKVEIVINGVPEPAVPRRQTAVSATRRVLFLGNLSERKGVADLLRACALPGFERAGLKVSICGGGDIETYRAQAQHLGVDDCVTFEGWADQNKAALLLANADVLVLPSYDEGLPLVILEAFAHGVAVVCTPVGEIPSVLRDGEHACFVKPGDTASIAAGLQRVLHDTALRETLERNGRQLYEQCFSLDRFFENIAQIHQRCFGSRAQSAAAPYRPQHTPCS